MKNSMHMAIMNGFVVVMFHSFMLLLLFSFSSNSRGGCVGVYASSSSSSSSSSSNNIYCLKTIKESLQDPLNSFNSWNFNNNITQQQQGFICKFIGVECWHPDENKVLNLHLSHMGLKGHFPRGIENCTSLTGLDLSNNDLSGSIPSDISQRVPFITNLDLSFNGFSGEIPSSLANCTYLNFLKLDHNRLTGNIPLQIGLLGRIKSFSVANNLLWGRVPNFNFTDANNNITREAYANNRGLCGEPLDVCRGSPPLKSRAQVIILAAGFGGVTVAVFIVILVLCYYSRGLAIKKKKEEDDLEGNRWAKNIKGTKGIKVSLFGKSVSKMKLRDLMKATDSFNKNNIIGLGTTGTVYKATFLDGTSLMVKRLQDSQRSEREFLAEMNTLGNVKHQNLVPLLGFCMAKRERLLVYKYMPNGTLYDKLHLLEPEAKGMEWPLRLRIGIGAARGLAWLHHSCNPRIIHRNISSKCILLDEDFEPKLSDFGLARLMNPIDTHLSTFVNGEFGDLGYIAPEYSRTLVASPKGDVYSFGTVLLELITGEKPTHVANSTENNNFKGSLAEWIAHLSSNSLLQSAIDKSLIGKGFDVELIQFLRVACRCVSSNPKERPTMFEVFQLLRAIGERYHFTADDILVLSETGDTDFPDELIVAQETRIDQLVLRQ